MSVAKSSNGDLRPQPSSSVYYFRGDINRYVKMKRM